MKSAKASPKEDNSSLTESSRLKSINSSKEPLSELDTLDSSSRNLPPTLPLSSRLSTELLPPDKMDKRPTSSKSSSREDMVSLRVTSSSDLTWSSTSLYLPVLKSSSLRLRWFKRPQPDLLPCSSSKTSWKSRRSKDVKLSLLVSWDNRELRFRSINRVTLFPPVNQRMTTSIMPLETSLSHRESWVSRSRLCFQLISVEDKESASHFLIRLPSRCHSLTTRRTSLERRIDNKSY